MTNRFHVEIIIGGASILSRADRLDAHAAIVSDLDSTQLVERSASCMTSAGVEVRASYLAAGLAEAEAAATRAGRATGRPFDVVLVRDAGAVD